ncbi:GNAT family N-acetyltransferase [Litoribaculum gwangyangense]|uniref:N-acetyltransferase domain-containing protein n=1 Tax=Litoribaculum gwangyangense TaxID=1130722 RepID=A0ABP9CGV6_9FLAO
MVSIVKATLNDVNLITHIGKTTFLQAHGRSAPEKDINTYVNKNFTKIAFEAELKDTKNLFNILYFNETPVGYSKIIFNYQHPNIAIKNVTKLERLYVLEAFHGLELGMELFNYNLNESIKSQQSGMWLFVWTENHKAMNFYKKAGFIIVGQHNFQISETHSNPNHQMFLTF